MVEQIIIKAKKLKDIDGIVLSTSNLPADDIMQSIAEEAGISWHRGSNEELADRHMETWDIFGLTHAITLSGDSPFFDLQMAQRLINGMREYPGFWTYGAYNPRGGLISGHLTGGIARAYVEAQVAAYRACNNKDEIQECYGQAYIIPEGDPRIFQVDCSDIMPPTRTAIKIDIDYPLEMAIMNRVIDYLGFFPERYEDIEKAYKEITTL